jgi:TPR repeat protein
MKTFRSPILATLLWLSPFVAAAAPADSPVSQCDKLAADPYAGFGPRNWDKPFQDIDAKDAIPACEAAMRLHPEEPRYRLQAAIGYLAANDRERAKPLLRALVEGGNAPAMVILAELSNGKDSVALLQRAAALDNSAALIVLALAQLTGDGVAENVLDGVKHLSRAADLGNTEAMLVLAGIYFEGRFGVPPDGEEGRRLILRAAELGNPSARDVLAKVQRAQAATAGGTTPEAPPSPEESTKTPAGAGPAGANP